MDQANQFVQVNSNNNARYNIVGGNGGGNRGGNGGGGGAVDGDGNAGFGNSSVSNSINRNTKFKNTVQLGASTEQKLSCLDFSIHLSNAKL